MSYRVFARKYRPQRFSELLGQTPIIQTLQNAITTNRLAQAYLFVGPRGVGKTSTARIFAKALNCINGPTITPCGSCDACIEIAEGRSLDVIEIDGASNNSVESIRTLRDNVTFAPARGPYKIYLIDEVHMLTTAAFNALLKTLEEPPSHVKFLFATTEAHKIPATIVSRCQRFDLHRLSEELIADHLLDIATKEKIILAPDAAQALAHGADGALRDAESMFDQVISFCGTTIEATDVQEVFGWTPKKVVRHLARHVFQNDAPAALRLLLEQSNRGKDLARLLTDFIALLRDLLIEKVSPQSEDPFFAELGAMVSTEKILTLLEELGNAEGRLRWASNKKLQLDIVIIKAIHLLQEVSLSEVLDALRVLREGVPVALPPAERPASQQLSAVVTVDDEKLSMALLKESAPPASNIEKERDPVVATTPQEDPVSAAWSAVAKELPSESPLKFGWIASGTFLEQRGKKIVVVFPPSCEAQTETLFWPQARKKIQECLSKNLGTSIELLPQFTGEERAEELSNGIFDEEETSPLPKPPQSSPAQTAPQTIPRTTAALTPEALADFKNDPLIQEALEIFKAEIIN